MKSGRSVLGVFDGLVDRALCVLGALLFSQAPEFMQQYLQRLGGHLHEAQGQLISFQEAAAHAGQPLDRFIIQTRTNPNPGISRLGEVMDDSVNRTAALATAYAALLTASTWQRPFVFLRHLDRAVARGTWSVYRPAVPVTVESLVYSVAGMLCFLLLYHAGPKRLFALRHRPGRAPA